MADARAPLIAATVLGLFLAGASGANACDPSQELLITELMASNTRTLMDENGDFSDWVEIYDPCLEDVDLDGWYLTDDPAVLTKWRFPSVHLARGNSLVVFASGKNRAVAGGPLHLNFKLAAEGEYLALVKPDGVTVAHEYAPRYPQQYPDVGYGLTQTGVPMVDAAATATWRVPSSDDAALGTDWTAIGYDASAWSAGPMGLGFTDGGPDPFQVTWYKASITVRDLPTAEAVLSDPATQASVVTATAPVINYLNTGGSGHFSGDLPFPGTTIGTDVDDYVVLVTGTIVIPATGPWTFGVNSDDGFGLRLTREPYVFSSSYPNPRGPGDTLATFDIPEAGAYSVRLIFYERGGGSELELYAAPGSLGSFSGVFRLVGDKAGGGLGGPDLEPYVGTDVRSAMQGVNATLWSRVPFELEDPLLPALLRLRIAYEDGFVAYLNGMEVARRNAPDPALWDSAAPADRPIEDAAAPEDIDLTGALDSLASGTNVLAVQGLNDSAADGDFLVRPVLEGVAETRSTDPHAYFPEATPGAVNSTGFPGVSGAPVFSRPSGLFADPFSLSVTTVAPGAVIRCTLDGSEPTAAHGTLVTGPLSITTSTRIRARVFEPGLAPGPVMTRLYAQIGTDVRGFTSNLPLVVVDTFGGGIDQEWLTETLTAVIPTTGTRASILDVPGFEGYAGIRLRGSSSLGFPKKMYALETWDENREDLGVSLLGMPAESDWVLNGPYSDKSLMRNVLAYKWSNDIGRYAPRTRLVEMYLRTSSGPVSASDYVGVYVLIEKVKRDAGRVNIVELQPTDETLPGVTGGYIIKKDRLDPGDEGFFTSTDQNLAYVEPKEHEIIAAQADYLKGYLDQFETVLYGPDFADPVQGYAASIDVDSFIDHHILVETTKNIDGFRLSTFMFKDRGARLNMGPIWDYNLTLGNANYLEGWLATGWYDDLLGDTDYPWWRRLFQDPEFRVRYADRWFALRRDLFRTSRLLADIEDNATLLDEAQARNYTRWPTLGSYVWPNWFISSTYREEIDWMKQWLADRLEWIDAQFVTPPVFNHAPGPVPLRFALTMTAPYGVVYYTIDGTDPRERGGAVAPGALVATAPLTITAATRIEARTLDGGEWSALNEGTFEPRPLAYVNEVLPVNVTVRADEHGEFDPWIELYTPFTSTMDLGGLYLTDDPAVPRKWPIPADTTVCGMQWLLVWADGEPGDGPLHAGFTLNPAGGGVWIHDQDGFIVDSLTYPPLGENVSYGRSPDGSATLASFTYATPRAANEGATTPILLNEYNAVAPNKVLAGGGTDPFWGQVPGNGGDWFELVVVRDHLDLRGWQVVVEDNGGATSATLTFTASPVLADLRSGTIITISMDLVSDVGYDPLAGDWWINLRAGAAGDGLYISPIDFTVSHQETRIRVLDASGAIVFGPAGEGINPPSGIGSDEVFKLEENPGPLVTAYSTYNDGTSSTFGAPNRWSGGTLAQDFSALRSVMSRSCSSAAECGDLNPCTDDACVDGHCENTPNTAPCDDGDPCTTGDQCALRQCRGQPVDSCCISDCECDDGDPCTADRCVENACVRDFPPAGTQCDDGDPCTVGDECRLGACAGSPLDCDDLDPCTVDLCDAGACLYAASGTCGLSGTVRYYRDGAAYSEPGTAPAAGVGIDTDGDGAADAVTDAAGSYALADLHGQVRAAPLPVFADPRPAGERDAITSFDAVAVARHAVGQIVLSPNQRIAADVSGNGEVTSFDAARVAQFAVRLVDHFDVAVASGSDWRFLRCDHYTDAFQQDCGEPLYSHDPLAGEPTDDFYAVLYGEVTGNWSPGAGFAPGTPPGTGLEGAGAAPGGEAARAAADRLEAARLRSNGFTLHPRRADAPEAILTLGGWTGSLAKGSRREVTLALTSADGIEGLDVALGYDPARLRILEMRTTGIATSATLATNDEGGLLRIALFGAIPLSGDGDLLVVSVEALRATGPDTPFTMDARANEGRIPVRVPARTGGTGPGRRGPRAGNDRLR